MEFIDQAQVTKNTTLSPLVFDNEHTVNKKIITFNDMLKSQIDNSQSKNNLKSIATTVYPKFS